ncbi:MAG: 4-hydroxy-4-methyl-2-oxoglutarate aldolase [Solirubrobacteraceae bacterium]|jgi:4-hydroxy-4-methyl-2-oxoglutarate aldolase|nr:4-hydroxy-4-methyl-2-oxoglutarate aldolase [Solirubrobacteraceae bacterium]
MAEHPLAGLSSATVHEAYGMRGALPSAVKPVDPDFYLCGPVFTIDCPPADNLWLHRAIYAAAPGDVLVADMRGHTEAGYWGEVLSQAAIARGIAGLVMTGGVRDTREISTLRFPVFAANVCIRGTVKDPRGDGRLGGSMRIGDVDVHPGDTVVGDADGAVVVGAHHVDSVAQAGRARVASEREMLKRLRRGESTIDILGLPT